MNMRKTISFPLGVALLVLALAPEVGRGPMAARRPPEADQILDAAVVAAGGMSSYERLESVTYEFAERRAGDKATARGRHWFKFHDGQGLRGREDVLTTSGRAVTVFDSSGVWRWESGASVTDPARLAAARRELEERFFWVGLPFNLRESAAPVRYAGLGYFAGKLTKRLEASVGAVGVPDGFTLYLDSGSYRLEGATVGAAPSARTVLFGDHATVRRFVLPLRRDDLDADGRPTSTFLIGKPELNNLIDDTLFLPTPPPAQP
jgi:hypothetical protein